MEFKMKVGDLIKHKPPHKPPYDWFVGQKFLVIEAKDAPVAKGWIGTTPKHIRVIRMPDGYCLSFYDIESWEVISESG